MHAHMAHTWPALIRLTVSSIALTAALVLMLTPLTVIRAQDPRGSNTQPLAFGPDQTIIDLSKLVWTPMEAEGVAPGPEMAVLRGNGKTAWVTFGRCSTPRVSACLTPKKMISPSVSKMTMSQEMLTLLHLS
jgi:hypothetical protein